MLEKIEAGHYNYRGIRIYKYKHHGFSYNWRRIKKDGHSYWHPSYPVKLSVITSKIDAEFESGATVENGWILFNEKVA